MGHVLPLYPFVLLWGKYLSCSPLLPSLALSFSVSGQHLLFSALGPSGANKSLCVEELVLGVLSQCLSLTATIFCARVLGLLFTFPFPSAFLTKPSNT